MSAAKMAEAGNELRLNSSNPHVVNLNTGEITALRKEGNIYVMDLYIKEPEAATTREKREKPEKPENLNKHENRRVRFKGESPSRSDDMDIGSLVGPRSNGKEIPQSGFLRQAK